MVDNKRIESIKVVGMQKKKEPFHSSNKHYEFILRVKWSNKVEITIYRPYSMFFDFQGVLCEMFKEKYSITIPAVPGTKFHWILLGKLGIEKECRSMEEFCNKIVNLPSLVSQSMVVLLFFDACGTDKRALNQQATEVVGEHGLGSPVIQSQETSSSQSQNSISTVQIPEEEDQYRSIAAFIATNPGEISFEENSIVTVIEKTERGWWFVWKDQDQQGWAPATYLEPIGVENKEETDEWIVVDAVDRAHLYTTVVKYAAQNPDEVSYDAGEEVEVIAKSNYGWWKIRHGDNVGLCPASNLKKIDEEYTSTTDSGRPLSISSASGLYAVIRKAPPRRDSVRKSVNFEKKEFSRFVYSAASFSGGKFVFDDKGKSNSFVSPERDETDSAQPNKQGKSATRAKSCNDGGMSYENVDMKRQISDSSQSSEDSSKGVKVANTEWYTALADFTPVKDRPSDLPLKRGDVMQLISVDAGWFFVSLTRGSDVIEGWVPSTYVERKWDVNIENMNISEQNSGNPSFPKPKPRPRQKQRDNDPTPPTSPPAVPTRTKITKPEISNTGRLSPSSPPPISDAIHERQRLPPPTAAHHKVEEQRPCPSSARMEEEIYDEPEAQLRSVYDSEPWFFGKTSRQECEQMLKQSGRQQEFLIRESTRGNCSYALSVKYCYRIRHFPIETTKEGELLIGKLKFKNLIDIVEYYKEKPLFFSEHKEPINLGNPFRSSKS